MGQALRDAIAHVPDAEARVRAGEFLYLPSGGGHAANEIYGDAIIPRRMFGKKPDRSF